MSYTAARTEEFAAMVDAGMYRDTLTCNGTEYECISNANEVAKEMRSNGYQEQIPFEFTIDRDRFRAWPIAIHDEIEFDIEGEGVTADVYSIITDRTEPTVIIRAVRKQ